MQLEKKLAQFRMVNQSCIPVRIKARQYCTTRTLLDSRVELSLAQSSSVAAPYDWSRTIFHYS